MIALKRFFTVLAVLFVLVVASVSIARADADAGPAAGVDPTTVGMQPIHGPLPIVTPMPGESSLKLREDGSNNAIPAVKGRVKTFHIVERPAPWTIKPGLTVMANTYNGVVPGPVMEVNQGDEVVIEYTNTLPVGDTIHLHGIHEIPVTMDGVAGISQALVPQNGHYTYRFIAGTPGTFIYHTHGNEALLDSGLYGAIVVHPTHPRPEEQNVKHDYVQLINGWSIQNATENHWTLNGHEYPAIPPMTVKKGEKFRIRWISLTGEDSHTMHTHGHYQKIIARDSQPTAAQDLQDTVSVMPGQRVDVIVTADQDPGTWLVHCHVMDHIEGADDMSAGLITAIQYAGTPNKLLAMGAAMHGGMASTGNKKQPLDFMTTALLGLIAGLTIFVGLPVARSSKLTPYVVGLLNAVAIGILLYLVIEIAQNALAPITSGISTWRIHTAGFPFALVFVFVLGLLLGLVGLGSMATMLTKRAAKKAENPLVLAAIIAIGIGAHNFAEGLAIGASAASGATAIAIGLIVGFALHNATEGFGVAAPLIGRHIPSWGQIGLAGLVAGGPTFLGTMVGYSFNSPVLSVFFLAIAVGALVFVIGELWSVLKRTGLTAMATTCMAGGFLIALATELFLDAQGG